MKKLFSTCAIASMMLLGSSCSQEDLFKISEGGDPNVTFNIDIPQDGFLSRADGDGALDLFGTGETATYLTYAVYEQRPNDELFLVDYKERENIISNFKATKSFTLVKGKTYTFVFWAEKAANADERYYSFDPETAKMTVKYDNIMQNDEERDAFFTSVRDFKVTDSPSKNDIVLRRPFAQIDFGSRDLNEPAVAKLLPNLKTRLTTRAANNLNLITGEATGEQEVTFLPDAPCTGYEFPHKDPNEDWGKTYSFLSMDYLLVPDQSSNGTNQKLVDMKYEVLNDTELVNTIDISNVPVQRNYQTCIFGRLLTSTTDFNITIDPAFYQPHKDVTFLEFRELARRLENGETVKLTSDVHFGTSYTEANDQGGTDCTDLRDAVIQIPLNTEATLDLNGHSLYNAAFEVFGTLNVKGQGEVHGWVHNQYGSFSYRPIFQCRKSNYSDKGATINIFGGTYYTGWIENNNEPCPLIYDGPYQLGTVNIYAGTFHGYPKTSNSPNCRYETVCYHDGTHNTKVYLYGGTFDAIDPTREDNSSDITFTMSKSQKGEDVYTINPTDMAKIISYGGDVTYNEESDVLDLSMGVDRTAPLTVTLGKNIRKVIVGDFKAPTTLILPAGTTIDNNGLEINGGKLSNFTLKGSGQAAFQGIGWSLDWGGKSITNVKFEDVQNFPAINYTGGNVSGLTYKNTKGWAEGVSMIMMKDMTRAENIVIDCPEWNGHRDVPTSDRNSYLYYFDDCTGDITINELKLFNYAGGAVFIRTAGKVVVKKLDIYYGDGANLDALHIDGSLGMTSCIVRDCNLTTAQNGNRLWIRDAQDGCAINVIGNTIDTSNPGLEELEEGDVNQHYGIRIDRTDGTPVNCSKWHIYGNKWTGWTGWNFRSKIEIVGFPNSGSPEDLSYAYRENE